MDGLTDAAAQPRVDASIPGQSRPLLSVMEVREPARRWQDGSVSVVLLVPALIFLYGPFLRLNAGRYRIVFRCKPHLTLQGDHPAIGLEVIAQNRILRAWRDYNAAELRSGAQELSFSVPHALSIESGADAPFEFRFSHFGNALLTMTDVTLYCDQAEVVPANDEGNLGPWRLLGRLKTLPIPGDVRLSPVTVTGLKIWRSLAELRLPAGQYGGVISCELTKARSPSGNALEVIVQTRDGHQLGRQLYQADQLSSGTGTFSFTVPRDVSLDVGAPRPIDVKLRHFANASLRLRSLDILRTQSLVEAETLQKHGGRPLVHGKKRLLIFGNCQGSLLAEALRNHSGFARHFTIKHHYMELPPNLHEQGRRDIAESDMLLIQDIREWEHYPLRAEVPSDLPSLRYPCVRFASPWPFDAFNGPDDKVARNRDYPNFEFTYFDGLLARLRKEIPDPDARFKAYQSLEVDRIIDVTRLHRFEQTRLEDMDRRFDGGIGAYILDRYKTKQVFYTTAHPNGHILKTMVQTVSKELGVSLRFWLPGSLNSLRRLQVPIHPLIAARLGIGWAHADRKYLVKGEWIRWEDYVRRYITYYG
ncbi:WcbI family polysaccharide biosynthesis putative acetyltransferase [Bosea sp. (in: a-proteobacteria)]|uniref:WcbI family polysaccharide biosynthesis putative acetyltransferase n=1 Tax=Bosea sp. (in: a-proteobacteria) TaxID=1871050 RepID=UPI003F6E99C0